MTRYRPNVALILRRADGRILIGERLDVAGAWQFPQGGVDQRESTEEALTREVREELSLEPNDYDVMDRKGPYRYDYADGRLKHGYGGQEQTYFLADFVGNESTILANPATPEFRQVRWIDAEEFRSEWVPTFKRGVYREVFRDFFGIEI